MSSSKEMKHGWVVQVDGFFHLFVIFLTVFDSKLMNFNFSF